VHSTSYTDKERQHSYRDKERQGYRDRERQREREREHERAHERERERERVRGRDKRMVQSTLSKIKMPLGVWGGGGGEIHTNILQAMVVGLVASHGLPFASHGPLSHTLTIISRPPLRINMKLQLARLRMQ